MIDEIRRSVGIRWRRFFVSPIAAPFGAKCWQVLLAPGGQ
jgi:hypothetical protein